MSRTPVLLPSISQGTGSGSGSSSGDVARAVAVDHPMPGRLSSARRPEQRSTSRQSSIRTGSTSHWGEEGHPLAVAATTQQDPTPEESEAVELLKAAEREVQAIEREIKYSQFHRTTSHSTAVSVSGEPHGGGSRKSSVAYQRPSFSAASSAVGGTVPVAAAEHPSEILSEAALRSLELQAAALTAAGEEEDNPNTPLSAEAAEKILDFHRKAIALLRAAEPLVSRNSRPNSSSGQYQFPYPVEESIAGDEPQGQQLLSSPTTLLVGTKELNATQVYTSSPANKLDTGVDEPTKESKGQAVAPREERNGEKEREDETSLSKQHVKELEALAVKLEQRCAEVTRRNYLLTFEACRLLRHKNVYINLSRELPQQQSTAPGAGASATSSLPAAIATAIKSRLSAPQHFLLRTYYQRWMKETARRAIQRRRLRHRVTVEAATLMSEELTANRLRTIAYFRLMKYAEWKKHQRLDQRIYYAEDANEQYAREADATNEATTQLIIEMEESHEVQLKEVVAAKEEAEEIAEKVSGALAESESSLTTLREEHEALKAKLAMAEALTVTAEDNLEKERREWKGQVARLSEDTERIQELQSSCEDLQRALDSSNELAAALTKEKQDRLMKERAETAERIDSWVETNSQRCEAEQRRRVLHKWMLWKLARDVQTATSRVPVAASSSQRSSQGGLRDVGSIHTQHYAESGGTATPGWASLYPSVAAQHQRTGSGLLPEMSIDPSDLNGSAQVHQNRSTSTPFSSHRRELAQVHFQRQYAFMLHNHSQCQSIFQAWVLSTKNSMLKKEIAKLENKLNHALQAGVVDREELLAEMDRQVSVCQIKVQEAMTSTTPREQSLLVNSFSRAESYSLGLSPARDGGRRHYRSHTPSLFSEDLGERDLDSIGRSRTVDATLFDSSTEHHSPQAPRSPSASSEPMPTHLTAGDPVPFRPVSPTAMPSRPGSANSLASGRGRYPQKAEFEQPHRPNLLALDMTMNSTINAPSPAGTIGTSAPLHALHTPQTTTPPPSPSKGVASTAGSITADTETVHQLEEELLKAEEQCRQQREQFLVAQAKCTELQTQVDELSSAAHRSRELTDHQQEIAVLAATKELMKEKLALEVHCAKAEAQRNSFEEDTETLKAKLSKLRKEHQEELDLLQQRCKNAEKQSHGRSGASELELNSLRDTVEMQQSTIERKQNEIAVWKEKASALEQERDQLASELAALQDELATKVAASRGEEDDEKIEKETAALQQKVENLQDELSEEYSRNIRRTSQAELRITFLEQDIVAKESKARRALQQTGQELDEAKERIEELQQTVASLQTRISKSSSTGSARDVQQRAQYGQEDDSAELSARNDDSNGTGQSPSSPSPSLDAFHSHSLSLSPPSPVPAVPASPSPELPQHQQHQKAASLSSLRSSHSRSPSPPEEMCDDVRQWSHRVDTVSSQSEDRLRADERMISTIDRALKDAARIQQRLQREREGIQVTASGSTKPDRPPPSIGQAEDDMSAVI